MRMGIDMAQANVPLDYNITPEVDPKTGALLAINYEYPPVNELQVLVNAFAAELARSGVAGDVVKRVCVNAYATTVNKLGGKGVVLDAQIVG